MQTAWGSAKSRLERVSQSQRKLWRIISEFIKGNFNQGKWPSLPILKDCLPLGALFNTCQARISMSSGPTRVSSLMCHEKLKCGQFSQQSVCEINEPLCLQHLVIISFN